MPTWTGDWVSRGGRVDLDPAASLAEAVGRVGDSYGGRGTEEIRGNESLGPKGNLGGHPSLHSETLPTSRLFFSFTYLLYLFGCARS